MSNQIELQFNPSTALQIDNELITVKKHLLSIKDLETKVGNAIRDAIDAVIAGRYTGRYKIEELDKTEKTYIGTKVQHVIQHALDLPYGNKLDANIAGIEVDLKFTIRSNWTIPLEAIGELCLLISAQDSKSTFQFGLIRTTSEVLNEGKNRDQKTTISKKHKESITWLIENGSLPQNILLHLPEEKRNKILLNRSDQARIIELFRLCTNTVFNGTTIETVAPQKDSSRRVRQAREVLVNEGIVVCSHYDNKYLENYGYKPLKKGEFMSVEDPNYAHD